ncbi:ATP-binding protein [Nonomuraea jiangxiensis]|uniref:Anti-sigma regulatory factor (Ser/Thr protein kinase) n=1 Tax=Nonomuraea jiangxiensis TaxID=633440 RepID=A0A1G8WZK7_9ACTN|nr:ATP-binding protein [Nonomuraea jiangxiensis]SDJ83015.1 Anti-sigma regulatory factor (Ser/Thr protein kinase) [Nonomuraea jiangxiensis]
MAQPDVRQAAGSGDGEDESGPHDRMARLPGMPSQVSRARQLVTSALGRDHPFYDDVVLLTSELATNAVLHTRSGCDGSFTVTVTSSDALVRVHVSDAGSEGPPCVCRTGAQATGGRGLPLVEALSHRWGFVREGGATTVWFELVHSAVPAEVAV